MPTYGRQTNQAGRSFWRACADMTQVVNSSQPGSLLAENFNILWCEALNRVNKGERIDYFAMLHDDVGAGEGWLDTLIEELEAKQLDILGTAVAIKDGKGLTSLALHNGPIASTEDEFELWLESCGVEHSGLNSEGRAKLLAAYAAWYQRTCDWRPFCRLSMYDVFQLPETFTSEDAGRPLLINSGCWVCKFDMRWATKVHFEVNDRISLDPKKNIYHAQVEPEDWYFSRQLHELGLKVGATRKLLISHRGECDFGNAHPWGRNAFDVEYTNKSPLPEAFPYEVRGWLSFVEGKALTELARGKRVLEIGSYCGRSTICLAQTAESVTAVDYFDGRATPEPGNTYDEFASNLKRYGVAHKVVTCHPEAEFPLPEYDMALIDGAHDPDSVREDTRKALSVLSDNGLLLFHDYKSPSHPDVTKVVDELIGDGTNGAKLISTHGLLAVVKPPAHILSEV